MTQILHFVKKICCDETGLKLIMVLQKPAYNILTRGHFFMSKEDKNFFSRMSLCLSQQFVMSVKTVCPNDYKQLRKHSEPITNAKRETWC